MSNRSDRYMMPANEVSRPLALAAALMSLLIYVLHLITHFPFFDESVRVRFLWLMSSGLKPNIDFFSPHPVLGYLLTLPYMSLFPESAFVVLALRSLSLMMFLLMALLLWKHGREVSGDGAAGLMPFLLLVTAPAINTYVAEYSIDHIAALAACSAFVLMFSSPSYLKIAAVSGLSCLSVLVMPKYALPLLFGFIGYATSFRRESNLLKLIGYTVAGVSSIFLAAVLFSWASGISLLFDMRHTHLLFARLASSGQSNLVIKGDPLTLSFVVEHMFRNPALGIAIVLGFAGWFSYGLRCRGYIFFSGAGILSGAILSSLLIRSFFEQYVTPVMLCFVLFVPFAFTNLFSAGARAMMRILLIIATVTVLFLQLNATASEFRATPYNARGMTGLHTRVLGGVVMVPPGVSTLADYEKLLGLIPKDETVAAVWPYHPLFRKDVTFVTVDDLPSHALGLHDDDPVRKQFEPNVFQTALDKRPPAFIAPSGMEINYPPGWYRVALDFIRQHEAEYVPYAGGYLRRDLLKTGLNNKPGE